MFKSKIIFQYVGIRAVLLLLASSVGCMNKKDALNVVHTYADTTFKSAYNVKSNLLLDLNTLTNDVEIFDSLLVVSGIEKEKIVNIISIPLKKTIDSLVERGDEENRLTHVTEILRLPGEKGAWLYDVTLQKFLHINLANILKGDTAIDDHFSLSKRIVGTIHPIAVKEELFAATSFSRSDLRFFKFNRNSDIVSKIGKLPGDLTDIPDKKEGQILDFQAIALESVVTKHPSLEKYAVASKMLSLIEFYNGATMYRSIRGPQFSAPIYKIGHPKSGPVPVFTGDTKFRFLQIKSTETYVTALYSGNKSFQTWGNTILVYDWATGLPKKKIILDSDASAFCVKEEGAFLTIYFLEHNTGRVRNCKIDTREFGNQKDISL